MKPNGLTDGEWINLGHISGMFSHPHSETYKCNYCGHEQYTVFGFPALPSYCPHCGQHMKNGSNEEELKWNLFIKKN